KHIRVFHSISKGTLLVLNIGNFSKFFFCTVHARTAFVNDTGSVAYNYIFNAKVHNVLGNSYSGRTSTVYNAFNVCNVFLDIFEGVDKRRAYYYSSAVLVIMEYWYITYFLEFPLYFKTARRGNIFEIYTAK